MSQLETLERHAAALRDLVEWLGRENVPYCIIGGVAASIVGRPRATRDVDVVALLEQESWETSLQSASECGLTLRSPDGIEFAKRARVLLMFHSATRINIDVSLGALPFERECIQRARTYTFHEVAVKVASPEDLLVMKAIPARQRDWGDIEGILDANPGLDLRRVRRHLRSFAETLDSPEIIDQFESFIARRRKRKGR